MNIKFLTLVSFTACCVLLDSLAAQKNINSGFAALDANGNGSLTLAEYEAVVLKKQSARWQAQGRSQVQIAQGTEQVKAVAKRGFAAMDWDGNGKVTFPEMVYFQKLQLAGKQMVPFSDLKNEGGWVLNTDVSDEFDAPTIDEEKWYIVGKFKDGKPFYKHPDKPNKKVWTGRAPSQFSGRNYRLEDGKLILETRWEPDFPFIEEVRIPVFGEALPYENITTACFIGRREFQYGYIEIRSKAADAEISSAFWAMGEGLEIDFFELFGSHSDREKKHLDAELWWSIRDWGKLNGKPTYTEHKSLGFRVAEKFHVYGFEWDEKGVKYYIDGRLFSEVSADDVRKWARQNRDVGKDYDGYACANEPISLWLDQETFTWKGFPTSKASLERNSPKGEKDDGVVDFEIEYVRVWQKK